MARARFPDESRVLGVDDAVADRAFEALAASTARNILSQFYEQPASPSECRDMLGTSIQTIQYHREQVGEAGLIEPAGVRASAQGTDMTKYAPAKEAVVLVAGQEPISARCKSPSSNYSQ